MTCALFWSLEDEDECQECLKQLPNKPDHAQKQILVHNFETDDTETHDKLLKMIAELFLTIK